MYISDFLHVLPFGTYVRVKVAGCKREFAGKTGKTKTDELLRDVYLSTNTNPLVYRTFVLWKAREVYIECV